MKFLCFHGAIANTDNFSIQLQPLEKELEERKIAKFVYLNGLVKLEPPDGFKDYFGAGPHYRWYQDGGQAAESLVHQVRGLPTGDTPEHVIRALIDQSSRLQAATAEGDPWLNRQQVLEHIYKHLEEDPEIRGVLGYSEGASLGASVLLDEAFRVQAGTRAHRQLACGIFLTGWPPMGPNGRSFVLRDEDADDVEVDVPTLHVIGANDPYKDGALALYNVCDPGTANLFDTGKGHTLPRSGPVLTELVDAVEQMLEEAGVK